MKEKKYNILKWIAGTILGGLALFATIMVFGSNGTSWPEQVMAACLGALITILATRLLLSSQSDIDEINRKKEDEIKKSQEKHSAKLKVYSEFVSTMYEALRDDHVTSDEMIGLRTKLFGEVGFYAKYETLNNICEEIKQIQDNNDQIIRSFPKITVFLQEDLEKKENDETMDIDKKNKLMMELWKAFKVVIHSMSTDEGKPTEQYEEGSGNNPEIIVMPEQTKVPSNDTDVETNQNQQTEKPNEKCLKQQAWHFNMLSDIQLESLRQEKEQYELNLIEYGEYWRTNLVKQVGYGDIIMLFKRGGNGYWGAYKAIGTRIFNFDEKKETITWLDNRENPTIIPETDPQYQKDIEDFDIYKSRDDGATLCSSIIVKKIAFKEGGVGNPGGVYRRTISRYYPLYAGRLMKLFEDAEAENPGKIINPDEKNAYNYVN